MNSFCKDKVSIRPIIKDLAIEDNMTPEEQFQNRTLRPILKLQHESIVLLVKAYIEKKKNAFYNLSKEMKPGYIKNNLLADKMIVFELRGLVIGLFSLQELDYYLKNKSPINKRIQSLLLQRISSFLSS